MAFSGWRRLEKIAAPARGEGAAVPRVVYHLADLDKVAFVLGNIRNHISGLGGPGKVRIALVVHGPALKAFRSATPYVQVKSDLGSIGGDGVELHAGNGYLFDQFLQAGPICGREPVGETEAQRPTGVGT